MNIIKSLQNMGFMLFSLCSRSRDSPVLEELQASLPMLAVLQGADGGVVRHLDRIQVDDLGSAHLGQGNPSQCPKMYKDSDEVIDWVEELEVSPCQAEEIPIKNTIHEALKPEKSGFSPKTARKIGLRSAGHPYLQLTEAPESHLP